MISASSFLIMAGYCAIMAGYQEAKPYLLGCEVRGINRTPILKRLFGYTQPLSYKKPVMEDIWKWK